MGFSYVLGGGGEAVLMATTRMLQEFVEGNNQTPPAALWTRLSASLNRLGRGAGYIAIAAIDVASWDLWAKSHDLTLAESLGGVVGKSETAEVGVMEVQLTEDGATGILFDGIPEKISCLQWHGAEIKKLPAGAKVLATSKDCAVQAMSWGPRAYSMQFHVEIEHSTIADWATISEYADSLKAALGPSGQEKLEKDCAVHMNDFNTMAERLYLNWLQTSARV